MTDLEKIVVIPNTQGIYKIISMNKSSFLLEELITKKKLAFSITKQINRLKEIIIYTNSDDIGIEEVLKKILEKYEEKKIETSSFSDEDYRNLFNIIIPDYDRDQFHISHMKKIVKWYNALLYSKIINL